MSDKLKDIVTASKSIMDIGTGPNGSFWYDYVPDDTCVTGVDAFFEPSKKTKNYKYLKMDAMKLGDEEGILKKIQNKFKIGDNIFNTFDLVVANHVFEHVENPEKLAKGVSNALKSGGRAFISIPDPENFTDIFYHLIHPDGGGHVSLIKKERMIEMMKNNGFELESYNDIPDDWLWLETLYDWKSRSVKYFSDDKMKYIANVFRKELTPQRGYIYGGEYVFKKK